MNEVFLTAQRARFGQSSEKSKYVLGQDLLTLFRNEAEAEQDPKGCRAHRGKSLRLLRIPARKRKRRTKSR